MQRQMERRIVPDGGSALLRLLRHKEISLNDQGQILLTILKNILYYMIFGG